MQTCVSMYEKSRTIDFRSQCISSAVIYGTKFLIIHDAWAPAPAMMVGDFLLTKIPVESKFSYVFKFFLVFIGLLFVFDVRLGLHS